MTDLGFGRCRFALAGPVGKDFFSGYNVKRIATKYPKVARSYFESKGMDVQIIKIEGSVELAPYWGFLMRLLILWKRALRSRKTAWK